MSMNVRYTSRFHCIDNSAKYDIKILQEDFTGSPEEITLSGEPVKIEWQETDKLDPVQSSSATLEFFSNSDRKYVDLYTIKPGSIRMDIYRNDALYWSGTLDPELYEEPYAYKKNYLVSLTFSDMAVLDRIKFDQKGFITLKGIIEKAISLTGIHYSVLMEHVSTGISYNAEKTLTTDVSFLSDNYYDEDGEPMTWREVIDETLRPFALRLIQKNGQIQLYDLNAIASMGPTVIRWKSTDSNYSVDKIYNSVKLKFSPYHHNNMLDASVDRASVPDARTLTVKLNETENIEGFKIALSDTAKGSLEKAGIAKYFKITPVFSGSEDSGVAWTVKTPKTGNAQYTSQINEASQTVGGMLMKAAFQPFLANTYQNSNFMLKVSLDVLADVRFNPFESADMMAENDGGYPNERGDFNDRLKQWCNFSYIPIRLTLRDADGKALYHYDNKSIVTPTGGYGNWGTWQAGEGRWGDAFLAYYDIDDRKSNTGLGGWQTNKQCIGYCRYDLPTIFHKRGSGEFIKLPYSGGWLDLQVGSGLLTYDYESKSSWQTKTDIYWRIRWLLYRGLKIELVDTSYQSIQPQDVEINAWLNRDAKEELKIDTVVGTLDSPSPTALGQIFLTSDKSVKNMFWRAGVTDRLEKLFIGTVYTNYATRHTVLSGTVNVLHSFGIYTDRNEPGLFMLLGETQDLKNGTSEIKIVQFESDNYEGIEYSNG